MARVAQSAALWILLAPYSRGLIVPLSNLPAPWNPFDAFTDRQSTAWAIVAVRVVGGATVLPVMEEVRSLRITVELLHCAPFTLAGEHSTNLSTVLWPLITR